MININIPDEHQLIVPLLTPIIENLYEAGKKDDIMECLTSLFETFDYDIDKITIQTIIDYCNEGEI